MASFGGEQFDAEKVDPQKALDPVPAGEYAVVITDSEEKANSKNTGTYLQLNLEIIEGEYKGRKLWERLNLNNPSDEAVGIARSTLSSICRAVGVMKPNDSTDLHNLPMKVKVGMEKRKDTGELTNKIKGYIPRDATASSPKTGTPATPPWKRKTNGTAAPAEASKTA